jgi:steroid delta-isomerase-like uncharacterized protein
VGGDGVSPRKDVEERESGVEDLIDRFQDAWSGKDRDAFVPICTEAVSYEDPLIGEPLTGPEALAGHAARLWAAFPDVRVEKLGPRLSDGTFVAAPMKLLATHKEALEGLPATNKFVVVSMVCYCELERGRLRRVRAFFDLYEAATQLGVLPARGTLGEKALLMLRGFGLRAGR